MLPKDVLDDILDGVDCSSTGSRTERDRDRARDLLADLVTSDEPWTDAHERQARKALRTLNESRR